MEKELTKMSAIELIEWIKKESSIIDGAFKDEKSNHLKKTIEYIEMMFDND